MNPIFARVLTAAAVLCVVAYVGLQGTRRALGIEYVQYVNADLERARTDGLLLGEYRTDCASDELEDLRAYAARPTTKELGYALVGTRIIVPDAVAVTVDTGDRDLRERFGSVPQLEFDDGAGVFMGVDGGDKPIRPAETIGPYGPNVSHCCFSHRSRVPVRFWLTTREGERLCTFTFDEATRRDVPPETRWTW